MGFDFLYFGIGAFLIVLLLHILVWNVWQPKAEIKPLLLIFIILPTLGWLVGLLLIENIGLLSVLDLGLSSLLYYALAAAYIQTYPAITTEIPSFRVLLLLHEAGESGLSRDKLVVKFGTGELLESRLELMKEDSLVKMEGDRIGLSAAGNLLATIFMTYRRLLGLNQGKG